VVVERVVELSSFVWGDAKMKDDEEEGNDKREEEKD